MENDPQPRVLVTPDDLLGFEIDGRYRLDAIVGGGGMGVVYRTVQQNLNRPVAIKLLKLEDIDNKHRLDRFKREIDIVAQLTHPNIVRVFDTGRDPMLGLHYIAMELVDGPSLEEVMLGNRMTPELAMDVAFEIAAGLTEPHKLGIIHRDIKPANVLVVARSDDTVGVKVVDFGIARTENGGTGRVTTTGVVVGSPMYMAPEVTRGEALDPRTDLYSLGVLLYEMISGRTPFGGATPVAIMLRHAVEDPPSLADSVGSDFAYPELVELVDHLLRKELKDRPQDAKSVLRALETIRATYGLTRVQIDSAQPIKRALQPHLHPAKSEDVPDEVDAYSPTTPVDAMGRTGSDSFVGWLVSESARAYLGPGRRTATESMEGPLEESIQLATRGNSKVPYIIVAAISVIIVAFVAGAVLSKPGDSAAPAPAAPDVTQLGGTVEKSPPVAEPATPPPAEPTAQPDMPAEDASNAADVGIEETVTAAPKPAQRPNRKSDDPAKPSKEGKDNAFDKGLQWVQEK